MRISVHLVTWNGSKYIPYLFDSLRKQTYKNFKLIILDNASTDDTVAVVETQNFASLPIQIIKNSENKGFAGGHNQIIAECRMQNAEYILLLNQDMYLMPDCLKKLVKFMDEHVDVAAVSPRLMRWDFVQCHSRENGNPCGLTNQIDTLGLKVYRNRRVVEIGTGQEWSCHCEERSDEGNMSLRGAASDEAISLKWGIASLLSVARNDSCEVFGVSGALPMYRKSVIDKVGLFDENFGSYKEDVDLAYRLRSAGFKSYIILDAVAYHDRSAVGVEKTGDLSAIENKKKQSELVKYNSYKNHLMTLIKNEYWQNYLLDLPWIKWYELKKFAYFLVFDRKVLKGLWEIWRLRRELRDERYEIKNKRKISWKEMRRWWK